MSGRVGRGSRPQAWQIWVVVLAAVAAALVALVLTMATSPGQEAGQDDPGAPAPAEPPRNIGYVPYWDQERGFDIVRANLDLFDEISPVWYSLEPTGEVVLADAAHVDVDMETVRYLQENGIRVIPTITNLRDGSWNPDLVTQMLHDPQAREAHVQALVDLAVEEGYDGIDIDYESLQADDREPFSAFVTDLGGALREQGKVLTVDVHPKTDDEGSGEHNIAQDYQAIGAAADQVRVMTYDYSWEDSRPGPVAPASWVEDVIAWTVTQIPSEKVILGIVLLGYDWSEGKGTTVDYQQATGTADEQGADIRRANDGSPWYRYQDSDGINHEVWYEDATSVQNKLDLVYRYGLGGTFFWRLGGEDPQVWSVVRDEM